MYCSSHRGENCFNVASVPVVKTGVGLFLYGVYTVLYILCIYILATRKRNRHWVHVVLITALYIAATVEVGMKLVLYTMDAQNNLVNYSDYTTITVQNLRLGVQMMTSIANILTDTLLLWRFYHTWGRTKSRVMIFPCIIVAAADVYGGVRTYSWSSTINNVPADRKVPLVHFSVCALVSNLILTSLIAGRIFYIAYQVGKHLPVRATVPTLYRTVLSATLESGLIYPVALIIRSACVLANIRAAKGVTYYSSPGVLTRDLVAATVWDSLITIMGIASTMIIVRVSLGIAIHDEKSFKETIVKEYEATLEQPSLHSVVDIRRRDSEDTESTGETLNGKREGQKSR
ncbi:hypothetical protein PM082_018488 [Marasmius tenuissimus]|nr:hypothetical protein PM082_018488 [Marasmius tenuissimus]